MTLDAFLERVARFDGEFPELCECEAPAGRDRCERCGGLIPSAELRLLALTVCQQREILERLEGIGGADEPAPHPERLLSAAELAEALGRSRDWVYEHRQLLGGKPVGDGPRPRWWFDLEAARTRLAEAESERAAPRPAQTARRRRVDRRRSPTRLLPIKGDEGAAR